MELYFTALDSWDNTTFATQLCNAVAASLSDPTNIQVNGVPSLNFIIPDCLFDLMSTLAVVEFYDVVMKGNATYPDPLVRLAESMLHTDDLIIRFVNGFLLNPDDTRYIVDWNAIFAAMPTLTSFALSGVYIGETTLPTIPATLNRFELGGCGIISPLPATLLNQSITDLSSWREMHIYLNNNELYGTIPEGYLAAMGELTYFDLHLNNNNLTAFPTDLFGPKPWSNVTEWRIDLSNNFIAGTIPEHLVAPNAFPLATEVHLLLNDNLLDGSIPATMIQDAFASIDHLELTLAHNSLIGDIPSGLLLLNTTEGGISSGMSYLSVPLNDNSLNGTIADDLFTALNWTRMSQFSFVADNNPLQGGLPTRFIDDGVETPSLSSFAFSLFDSIGMTGTIPLTLLPSLAGASTGPISSPLVIQFTVAGTSLSGEVLVPSFASRSAPVLLDLRIYSGEFTSLVFDAAAFASTRSLFLDNNHAMTGTLPDSIFNASSVLSMLSAYSTALSGTMPDLGALRAPNLTLLHLHGTEIDVCSSPRSLWNSSLSLTQCRLPSSYTPGACHDLYPSLCVADSPVGVPPSSPPSRSSSSACKSSTRPDPSWVCVGGVWTFNGFFTNSTFIIPSGTTAISINGSLNASTIVFQGVGATLTITNGCAANLGSVVIELSPSQLTGLSTKTPYKLIVYPSVCNATSVSITAKVVGSSCKKVNVETISSGTALSGLFSLDSSKCNTWWVILVSVVGGVILLTALILVLLVLTMPKFRAHLMPLKSKSATPAKASKR